jgi:hydroxymethylglutaryl-CoA synthase
MTGKQVMMFSYGSGCAASMFVLRFTDQYKQISKVASFKDRLAKRVRVSAEEYDSVMGKREQNYGKSDFSPKVNSLLIIFRMQSQLLKTALST